MNWLPFIIAYLIAPTLVIIVAYIFAVMLGLTVAGIAFLSCVALVGYTVIKTVQRVRCNRNPIHKTNKKYLKGRLTHLHR